MVPVLPESPLGLTAADVAVQVRSLGTSYEPYALKVKEDGLDGAFLQSISPDDLESIFEDLGVTSTVHRKKLQIVFKAFKESKSSTGAAPAAEAEADLATIAALPDLKRFAAFLSHYKLEAGTEARLIQQNLKAIIEKAPIDGASNHIFLDSDDLSDLRMLLHHVIDSKCLVLLQSKGVLTRPWVIAELYTAVKHNVPIVALNVKNASPYDYATASHFLYRFDEEIELANPGTFFAHKRPSSPRKRSSS